MNPFRRLLDELDEILHSNTQADEADEADDHQALHDLRSEVEDHLAHERPADEDSERHSRLAGILQDAEDRVQARHPRLTQAISQALNSLSDAGL